MSPDRGSSPHRPALIGCTVEKALDATLWDLVGGKIGLHDLTPALRGYYSFGFDDGRNSIMPLLLAAEADRDDYYERWQNPGKQLVDVRMRRMREAAEDYWAELMQANS